MDVQLNMSQIKQEFMLELMVFSPKYNAVTAEQLANSLPDEQIEKILTKLRAINEAREEELAILEVKDPVEYEKRISARDEEEQKADDEYFKTLEAKVTEKTNEAETEADSLDSQVDELADDADQKIDEEYDTAETLLQSLFEEVENAGKNGVSLDGTNQAPDVGNISSEKSVDSDEESAPVTHQSSLAADEPKEQVGSDAQNQPSDSSDKPEKSVSDILSGR